jgi:dephospho-CoA kinase
MLVIGLTGGIGSGKSTVAKEFLKLGIYIVDADKKARDAVALGKPALGEISEHFGSGILAPDGNLDRAKLRSLIFSAHEEKEWLEQLLHPLIRQDIEADLKSATSPYAILESPLLFETNQHQMTDKTLLIDVPIEIQVTRSCQRDNNTETGSGRFCTRQHNKSVRVKQQSWATPQGIFVFINAIFLRKP